MYDGMGNSVYLVKRPLHLNLRYVCEVVSRRASFMASAGIAALLKKMADYKDVVIAIDGSLFRYHPHFKNVMQSRISQVVHTVHCWASRHSLGFEDKNLVSSPRTAWAVCSCSSGPPAGGTPQIIVFKT